MNAIFLGLSLASAAAAQVANGVSAVPYSAVYGSAPPATMSAAATDATASSSNGYGSNNAAYTSAPSAYTTAPSVSSAAAASVVTPPPSYSSSSYDIYSAMPYSSFMSGGYKSLSCGYGYQKGQDGTCNPMSWWQGSGCYETIIINHE